MIQQKLKICIDCKLPRKIFSHGRCAYCARPYFKSVSQPKKPIKRSPIKKKFKVTGELSLFREIWNERPHVCEKCGYPIEYFSHKIMHHHKGKGKYPELRLVKSNILIYCESCHYAAHFGYSVIPLD